MSPTKKYENSRITFLTSSNCNYTNTQNFITIAKYTHLLQMKKLNNPSAYSIYNAYLATIPNSTRAVRLSSSDVSGIFSENLSHITCTQIISTITCVSEFQKKKVTEDSQVYIT
jgi:hypothetical protein